MAASTTDLRHDLRGPAAKEPTACTCKALIELKLLEQFKHDTPSASRHLAELQGYGFKPVGNTLQLQPFMHFKLTADYPNGRNAWRHRAKVGVMHFSFCPFCGQSLKKGG